MWITDTRPCESCGAQITLVQDGREAAVTVDVYDPSDGVDPYAPVWRDGQSLVVWCPVERYDEVGRCGHFVTFNGEGVGTVEPAASDPILTEAP